MAVIPRIKIRVLKGITPTQFSQKVTMFVKEVDAELSLLGYDARSKFRDVISAHRRRGPSRSGNRLSNSIDIDIRDLGIIKVVGVGQFSKMNSQAPYWKIVNYGGIVPPFAYGYFGNFSPPDSSLAGQGTEPFTTIEGGTGMYYFKMRPRQPIRPMNFIQTTINLLQGRWKGYWEKQLLRIWKSLPTPHADPALDGLGLFQDVGNLYPGS